MSQLVCRLHCWALFGSCAIVGGPVVADGPAIQRVIPRPGIELSEQQRQGLQAAIDRVTLYLTTARDKIGEEMRALLPDVEVLVKGPSYTLTIPRFRSRRRSCPTGP